MAQYSRKLAKGLKWFYKFDLKGRTYRSKAIYQTKQEAKKAEAQCLSEIEEKPAVKKEEIFLMTAISERLKYLWLKSSKKYYFDNARYFRFIYNHFGDCIINEISKKDIQDFILNLTADFNKRGKSNYSINAAIRCYKALFNFIKDNYELDFTNPFYKFKFFSIDIRIKYIPSDDEINALLKVCNKDQARLINFILDTGARINECLNLTYGDVFDDYIVLYTRKSVNSNRTPRKLPKPECLKDLNGKSDEKVFSSWSARPRFIETKLKKLGLPLFGYHNLRHRFASKLSKDGVPLFEIMTKLGHSSLDTTQIYLQLLS